LAAVLLAASTGIAQAPTLVSMPYDGATARGDRRERGVSEQRRDDAVDHLLGDLEAAIMRLMWGLETATVRDIFHRLRANGRPLAYTTVMTVMVRLAVKQLLTRELSGKTYVYRVALTEDEFLRTTAARRVQELVDEFGDLAIAQFLATVDDLSPERYAQLQRLAREDAS
jgi:predicted transcriptional regulator